jgi:hypothetical protein
MMFDDWLCVPFFCANCVVADMSGFFGDAMVYDPQY